VVRRIVDEVIRRGGVPAAAAIWVVLAGDDHADTLHGWCARCPAIAAVPPPPEGSFELGEPDAPIGPCLDHEPPIKGTVTPRSPRLVTCLRLLLTRAHPT
jgi:hypothetical protein